MRMVLLGLGLALVGCGADTGTGTDTAPTDGQSDDPTTTDSGTPCGGSLVDWYVDVDQDGFGDADSTPVAACTAPAGTVDNHLDCDDQDDAIHPDAAEICNDVDDDCNDAVDDGLTFVDYYPDVDLDGFGDQNATPVSACAPPKGLVTDATDCDDKAEAIHPAAKEVCNDVDDDCSGAADDGLTFVDYYPDVDLDGFGDESAEPVSACTPPKDLVADGTDCDDGSDAIHPQATEVCNLVDDDCNDAIDDGLGTPRTNEALGATVSATTTFGGYSAAKAVDGSRSTAVSGSQSWSSTSAGGTFEVDFGGDVSFGRVDLYTSDGYELADYDLEYWNGASWTALATVTDNTDVHRIHTFAEVTGSKIRFTNLMGPDHQAAYTRINEIEVYENQALSASASATATAGGYTAAETNDGSRATTLNDGWASDGNLPDTVTLNFGECRSFDLVELFTTSGYVMRDWDLEVYDGTSWSLVEEVRDNTAVQRTMSFDELAGEQLRVIAREGSVAQPGYARINELEVY